MVRMCQILLFEALGYHKGRSGGSPHHHGTYILIGGKKMRKKCVICQEVVTRGDTKKHRDSLTVQRLRFSPCNAGGELIPGQGVKIPHAK